MALLWLTLLLVQQGYTFAPVVTVELGQSVTLTCAFSRKYQSTSWVYWYKQRSGDTLHLIVMQQRSITPKYGPQFSASRFNVTYSGDKGSLTIISTVKQDEGMYHCAQMDALEHAWSGTNVVIKDFPVTGSKLSQQAIKAISLSAALLLCLIGLAVLICFINRFNHGHRLESVKMKESCAQSRQQREEEIRMYSSAIFTKMKTDNTDTEKTSERKMIFTAEAFSL